MPLRGVAKSAASSQQRKIVSAPASGFGGLVEEEHPLGRRPTDLIEARNCMRKGHMLGTRPGLELGDASYDAARTGAPGCQGFYEMRLDKDANRDLISVFDGNVYLDHDGSALDKATDSVQITTGDDYFWTFAAYQNKVFATGGKLTATVDDPWHWNGNPASKLTVLDIAGIGLSLSAQYVFSKWNFLFFSGMNGTTFSDNPLSWRYNDYASDATLAASWPTSNTLPGQLLGENFGPGSYGGEYSTGMGSFTDNKNDFLLLLTNRRIVAMAPNLSLTSNADAFAMSDGVDIGCVSQRAFVNLGQDVGDSVYLSSNGVHSFAQSKEFGNRVGEYLSWPIRNTFAGLNKSRLKYASGAYWPTEGVVLWLVSSGSSTTHNKILCLDIRGAKTLTADECKWYVWDVASGITLNCLGVARGSDDKPYIYAGDLQGRLMRFERDSYTDATSKITVSIQTANDDFGIPNKQKTVGDTYLLMQGDGSYRVRHTLVLNDGQTTGKVTSLSVPQSGSLWGTAIWGTSYWASDNATERQRVYGVGTSPTIGHKFFHDGAGQPFWIGSLTQEAFVSGPTLDAQTNES